MLTVGLVCEGPTDVTVFETLLEHLVAQPVEFRYLVPDLDALDGGHGGDTRVVRWCQSSGHHLEWLLRFQGIDLLLVHLDADRCPRYEASDTAGLCAVIKGWLGPGSRRGELLIVLPAQATEAWLVGAYENPTPQFESMRHPEDRLARLGKLERGQDGAPVKDPSRYRLMATDLISRLNAVRPVLGELNRFLTKLEAHPCLRPKGTPGGASLEVP